jgi:hypothetical protein
MSYMLSSNLLNIGRDPFIAGGYGDVYGGTLNGSKVCIKRMRVYTGDPQRAAKVRHWCHRLHCFADNKIHRASAKRL